MYNTLVLASVLQTKKLRPYRRNKIAHTWGYVALISTDTLDTTILDTLVCILSVYLCALYRCFISRSKHENIIIFTEKRKIIDFQKSDFWKLLRPPLIQFSKFKNFLWVLMAILRQNYFLIYTPRLKTPQPVLPYLHIDVLWQFLVQWTFHLYT